MIKSIVLAWIGIEVWVQYTYILGRCQITCVDQIIDFHVLKISYCETRGSDDILKFTMAHEGLVERDRREENLECAFSRLSIAPLTVQSLFLLLA